ncbi:MAG: hypothetical protein HFH23_15725 [Ruminococcus sp.]|nr:hypothetical protein [Ruminococcus sp.]
MNMYRKTVKLVNGYGHYSTYVCRRAATYGEADPPKNIKAETMEGIIMELLKAHISLYVDARGRMRVLNRKPETAEKRSAMAVTGLRWSILLQKNWRSWWKREELMRHEGEDSGASVGLYHMRLYEAFQ